MASIVINRKTCSQDMRTKLSLLSLDSRRKFVKIVHNVNCPHQLEGCLVKRSEILSRDLRDSTLLHIITSKKSKMGQSSFQCAQHENRILYLVRYENYKHILSKFKASIFKYFFKLGINNHSCSLG